MFIGLILIGVVIYLIYKEKGFDFINKSEDPIDKLKERYVKGEITEEEYIRMKDVLK